MPLTRAFEEQEVSPELRRIYGEARTTLDLPFVPTLFKVLAGAPEYLKLVWDDLAQVAGSREFHAAAWAYEEFVRSLAVRAGWRFSDARKILAAQKFSEDDMQVVAGLPPVFTRTLCQMSLFARLLQRGYGGGQRGRVSEARQASAVARIMALNIPNERDAGPARLAHLLRHQEDNRSAIRTRVFARYFAFPGLPRISLARYEEIA